MRVASLFFVLAAVALAPVAGADQAQEIFNPSEPYAPDSAPPAVYRTALTDSTRAVLYDNGPLVTHPGGGAGGADASAVQTALSMSLYGFGWQNSLGNRMADEFVVTDATGWQIDDITFFGYQTGSTTTSTFTGIYVQIWDGPPDAGGTVIWGNTTTNRLLTTGWSNIYRALDTTLTDTNRPVMEIVATIGTTLAPGTYWVDFSAIGTGASGPWAPPISILGQTTTGNALQYTTTGGVWAAAVDTGSGSQQGMPFIIDGSVVGPPPPPPPGTFFVIDEVANQLYTVELDTGSATYVGPTVEDPSYSGMAFDTSTGVMYLSDVTLGGGQWGLGTVNCSIGAVTIVGPHVNSTDIHALAYDSVGNVLWGSDEYCSGFSGPGLATVNRATGESVCIGSFGTSNLEGLAFDQTRNTLYGINATSLFTVDRATGAATPVGPHGIPGLTNRNGLEFIPDRFTLVATTESGDLYQLDPATGASTFVGNTGFTNASASGYAPFRAPAFPPFPGLLWDNGDTDFSNGYSNAVSAVFGYRRTLLDDFEVPAGQTWPLRHFSWRHAWNALTTPSATGVELVIRANDPNGGGAGIDGPGAIIATPAVSFFTETPTGRPFFGRPEMSSIAEFDPVALPAGRYWIEWTIVGPDNNFVPANQSALRDNECWVDWEDFGGLQPITAATGSTGDLAWAIGEARIGIFADGFESGGTLAWSSATP